jgi:hypothetical protein
MVAKGRKHKSKNYEWYPGTGSQRESPAPGPELRKQDSFEGHEAAVRSLVEAVQESRKLEAKQRKAEG